MCPAVLLGQDWPFYPLGQHVTRRPTKAETADPKAKPKIILDPSRRLIVCTGGPRDGFWFYQDDFPAMTHSGHYVGTDEYRDHPSVPYAQGRIVRWIPPLTPR